MHDLHGLGMWNVGDGAGEEQGPFLKDLLIMLTSIVFLFNMTRTTTCGGHSARSPPCRSAHGRRHSRHSRRQSRAAAAAPTGGVRGAPHVL